MSHFNHQQNHHHGLIKTLLCHQQIAMHLFIYSRVYELGSAYPKVGDQPLQYCRWDEHFIISAVAQVVEHFTEIQRS